MGGCNTGAEVLKLEQKKTRRKGDKATSAQGTGACLVQKWKSEAFSLASKKQMRRLSGTTKLVTPLGPLPYGVSPVLRTVACTVAPPEPCSVVSVTHPTALAFCHSSASVSNCEQIPGEECSHCGGFGRCNLAARVSLRGGESSIGHS